MKRIVVILGLVNIAMMAFGQKDSIKKDRITIETGIVRFYNLLNEDRYFSYKSSNSFNNERAYIAGLNAKVIFTTKRDYLDIIIGTCLVKNREEFHQSWSTSAVNISHYQFNGGGVYFGVSPHVGNKYIGLTSDFAVGVFSFKEYVSVVDNINTPNIDIHGIKASGGLGALSNIGFYAKVGRIGVNPSISLLFSGSSSASFTLYGFYLPLTIAL